MIGVVSYFLECRLRASQNVTVLSSKVCGVHTIERVLDQQVIRPEQPEEEEEENAEDKVAFLDTLKSVEATKYTCRFDIEDIIIIINIIIMCNKTENCLSCNLLMLLTQHITRSEIYFVNQQPPLTLSVLSLKYMKMSDVSIRIPMCHSYLHMTLSCNKTIMKLCHARTRTHTHTQCSFPAWTISAQLTLC
jgi:hypothetical protein